jgi:hypothetical protein
MKQLTNREYEVYRQYIKDQAYGRILTPDGLRLICSAFENDPEQIGVHMLQTLAKFRSEGIVREK